MSGTESQGAMPGMGPAGQTPPAASVAPAIDTVNLPQIMQGVKYDEDGVVFIFGKQEIKVPSFNFYTLKKVWGLMDETARETDTIKRVEKLIQILAIALQDTPNPISEEELQRRLRASEWPHLVAAYGRLLVESALITEDQFIMNTAGGPSTGGGSGEPEGGNQGEGQGPTPTAGGSPASSAEAAAQSNPAPVPTKVAGPETGTVTPLTPGKMNGNGVLPTSTQ